ncbi:hydroxyacylglutathione hydrolase [Undibacterium sp. LX40W]|uniref:Hydroxyacylglutathione hydrolase n=1 Tax=Undibacterium nitidum TaxID=2762298 RepID=A0A923KUH8_9BURK|nr:MULTISPECIES: hydroxyacylglutathione hydrolase [Undibacterium]MBC3883306.1 hydroxyacylglutathione hydrolase [Undibacterium nitidum]MBC3893547.1 hydroxyacylglutathione hydrolase [Undibacterium sp. LX40W]
MTTSLSILTVPAFDDNYLWIVHNGTDAVVVDPGDGKAILQALQDHQLQLKAILLTHHHADHVGGVPDLLMSFSVPVYGPATDNIKAVTHPLNGGDKLLIECLNLNFQVLAMPGHTLGHIAYYSEKEQVLFCGDTLFAGGCGRIFEGTPAQMFNSLNTLAALPEQTAVYCAHEYTLSNLRFALAANPNNSALQVRQSTDQQKRDQHIPTVPSTIGLEKQTNPFLRSADPDIKRSLIDQQKIEEDADELAVFTALRTWKNNF